MGNEAILRRLLWFLVRNHLGGRVEIDKISLGAETGELDISYDTGDEDPEWETMTLKALPLPGATRH